MWVATRRHWLCSVQNLKGRAEDSLSRGPTRRSVGVDRARFQYLAVGRFGQSRRIAAYHRKIRHDLAPVDEAGAKVAAGASQRHGLDRIQDLAQMKA